MAPIHIAAERGEVATVRRLLEEYPGWINSVDAKVADWGTQCALAQNAKTCGGCSGYDVYCYEPRLMKMQGLRSRIHGCL